MTIYPGGTRGDGFQPQVAAAEVPILGSAGVIPGVVIEAAGGLNGEGGGTIRQVAATLELQWKAPGSANYGTAIDVSAGGSFLLEDGDDPDAWVRITSFPSFQVAGAREAIVFHQDLFNLIGPDDVTAAEATAGDVLIYTVDLLNTSGMENVGLKAWLDPAVVDLEISDDGISFVAPTTEGTALALGNALPGASITLHIRRTISAAAPSDADVLNQINLSWEGL